MTINLAAIESRLKAITKWPWSIAYGGINESDEGFGIDSKIEPGIVAECWPPAADAARRKRCYADAHFIAHAPQDIASLLAEVRRLTDDAAEKNAVIRSQSERIQSLEKAVNVETAAFHAQCEINRATSKAMKEAGLFMQSIGNANELKFIVLRYADVDALEAEQKSTTPANA